MIGIESTQQFAAFMVVGALVFMTVAGLIEQAFINWRRKRSEGDS